MEVVELAAPPVFCEDPELEEDSFGLVLEDFDPLRLVEDDLGPVRDDTVDEDPDWDPLRLLEDDLGPVCDEVAEEEPDWDPLSPEELLLFDASPADPDVEDFVVDDREFPAAPED